MLVSKVNSSVLMFFLSAFDLFFNQPFLTVTNSFRNLLTRNNNKNVLLKWNSRIVWQSCDAGEETQMQDTTSSFCLHKISITSLLGKKNLIFHLRQRCGRSPDSRAYNEYQTLVVWKWFHNIVLRFMFAFEIEMNECPLNFRELLKLYLQGLAYLVGLLQRKLLRELDVDLITIIQNPVCSPRCRKQSIGNQLSSDDTNLKHSKSKVWWISRQTGTHQFRHRLTKLGRVAESETLVEQSMALKDKRKWLCLRTHLHKIKHAKGVSTDSVDPLDLRMSYHQIS